MRSASVGAFDQLHDERADAARILEAVNLRDVRMIERREHLRLAAEAREALGIVGNGGEQDLDRDLAIQLRIARAIHLAHAAGAQQGDDLVRAEAGAGAEGHAVTHAGTKAIARTGLPLPPTIFSGAAITTAPVGGSRSRLQRLASPNLPWPCMML